MPELTLYDDYSREDVHANFAPDTAKKLHGLTGKESAAAQVFSRDRKKNYMCRSAHHCEPSELGTYAAWLVARVMRPAHR